MTDGPAPTGPAGDPPRAAPATPPTPFPPTRPAVPHALLDRPTTLAPAGNDPVSVRPPRCERTANRLARLLRSPDARPAFAAHRLQSPDSPAAFAAALACPDLYLMDAPAGAERIALAVKFAAEAVAAGQRLLMLVQPATADEILGRLVRSGCRLAFCGSPDDLGEDSAKFCERALAERERADECRRLEALVTTEAAELDRLDALARRAADHDGQMEAARRELAELRQPAPAPPGGLGGFMKKLFGGSKPVADPAERIAALEEILRTPEPERIDPAHRDRVAAAHRDADAAFARAVGRPAELAAEAASGLQVVVATPAAFGDSPLLSESASRFDRLLVVHGEDMYEDDFHFAAPRAESWAVLGSPDGGHFADLWPHLHAAGPWRQEAGRLIARLAPGDPDATEPLFDRPEIELRFAGDVLAEVAFPAGTTLAEAKRFLWAELGEANPRFPAAGEWTENADGIACGCPGLPGDTADLGGGVREVLADGLTARVEFDKPAWDRTTAEDWLAARALPAGRTAVLPRQVVVA